MSVYTSRDILCFFLAIFFPYISVLIKTGCSVDLLINIALSILGHLPGVIHAFYIIHKHRDYVEIIDEGGLPYAIVPQDQVQVVPGAVQAGYGATSTARG
ncbi:uncharacterized protein VTP21DRAFT_9770 [Calcarisporiella thermophila]|uniref:uncharacterized protein n=1 Tax=Calcarisporiella thermophila TaxID=911321 RepID=UPI00374460B2